MCLFSTVPEEHWMGVQRDVKGPDTSFSVEPPGKNKKLLDLQELSIESF